MVETKTIARLPSNKSRTPVKVVAVTGGKGGVGKSAISANIALALALLGRRVMLLDGDLGLANAHLLLGLRPQRTLRHVVRGECSLQDAIVKGPAGLRLVAGANGFQDMARLTELEHAGIIRCFSEYESRLDVLMIDTASGISDSVLQFAGAANHSIVVVRDEPASIADAYSIIKLLYREKRIEQFSVVSNMCSGEAGARVFEHLRRTAERFLPVTLMHTANIPADEKLARAVRCQRPVVTAFPRSQATRALQKLAARVDGWEAPSMASGRLEFFVERLLGAGTGEYQVREIAS